jgi:hypothetical protein
MNNTKIIRCNCPSEYQDKTYGLGRRVANFARNIFNKQGGWRCCVCGTEQPDNKEKKT